MRGRRAVGALGAAVLTLTLATACGEEGTSPEGPSSGTAVQESTPSAGTDLTPTPTPSGAAMQQITSEQFSVQIPDEWEEYDLSNHNYIDQTRAQPDVRRHFGTPRGPEQKNRSVAFLSYTSTPGAAPGTDVEMAKIVAAMDQAQKNLATDQARQSYASMEGHGCLDGYESLGEVQRTEEYGEPGQLTGVWYEYRCLNSGMPMRGYALAAYSEDGRRHDVFLTTDYAYWEAHEDQLRAVIESIGAG
ncbi:hypothetical protein [Micrococcus terreus]|uniref:hypothetical protein n=1 Tax=Micrococcus terreus TaxID=574650 RepID=UPI002551275F|nr:hypothetical protein [Micrococcus terreus]MDK7700801.1 hypothetical protein [Micrococcus terreus]WOO96959.1 hypothetical protein R3I42_10575 [Micrococcus terreus]